MDVFSHLDLGFSVALTASNILYCFTGVLLGTLVGILPGLGPVASIAMLLPVTYALPPSSALIMLAGIYYGAQYGGSTTAILINIPGESSSVVTAIDGYKMALKGRAGPALGIAAIGSFIAGCVSTLAVAFLAPVLSDVALNFGPAEYFSLMAFGLVASVVLARGSVIKAIAMIITGLLLGLVGTDVNSGTVRYAFGIPELADGVGFIALSMALFGLAEIATNLEGKVDRDVSPRAVGRVLPGWPDVKQSAPSIARGTILGSLLGVLPGGGALLASFAAYTLEKRTARPPRTFGEGDIRGVAGPEAANNAGAQTSFIPMITLGVPSNPTMALMIGALMIQGIAPGPGIMTEQPELFWGLIASMWIGNLMLLVLNLPLIGIWIRLLKIPYRLLFPSILVFCAIGVYSSSNNVFDVYLMAALTVLGYIFIKLDCEPAPLILGFILGPMMEENLRRAMLISRGDPSTFFNQPISLSFLVAIVVLLVILILPSVRETREVALRE
ncbi:tripartite tricarboxylate transporter permease [Pseudochelatococcus sp. B33]